MQPFSTKPPIDSRSVFEPKNSVNRLNPLTLPSTDLEGRIIQLWKRGESQLMGSVLDSDGRLSIIRQEKINNPLNPAGTIESLIQGLESFPLRSWKFVYQQEKKSLTIWPVMVAAGKYDGMDVSSIKRDVERRLQNLVFKKGALNREHYSAYRREKRGEVLKINPKDNEPYDHVEDVSQSQNAAVRLIRDIKGKLSKDGISSEERSDLEKLLSKVSLIKDESVKYTNSKPKTPSEKRFEQRLQQTHLANSYAKKQAAAASSFSSLKGPGEKIFHQTIQKTNLCESYNQNHADNPIVPKGASSAPPGGIGCDVELLKGLFNTPESLFEDEHLFYLPLSGDDLPFSDEELRQLLRELAIGIYVHDTVPFFSLHFNQDGNLYPVIHPVYEKTLVGQVISMLDYIMKGYLNGGVFSESFIQEWGLNPDWDEKFKSGLHELINFKDYCKQNLKKDDQDYLSLRDLTFSEPPSDENEPAILKDYTQFLNSFRIIAKQKSIQKAEELFVIDWDFDVKYTIDPNQEYLEVLQKFFETHGKNPPSYEKMINRYELMTKLIHDHMSKLPLCQKYFSMLGLINFFSSYFMTLKKHCKIPSLPTFHSEKTYGSPSLFPHLPIGQFREEIIALDINRILQQLLSTHSAPFKIYLNDKTDDKNCTPFKIKLEELISYELLSVCTEPMLRAIQKGGFDRTMPAEIAPEFLKYLQDAFEAFCAKKSYSNPVEKFLEDSTKLFRDISFQYSIGNYILSLQCEHEKTEIENGKKIIGGCGLEIAPQVVLSSPRGEAILQNEWANIDQGETERWIKVKEESGSNEGGAVFRLMFEDVPFWALGQYEWMESALFDSPEGMVSAMETITRAIFSNEKELFESLLVSTPHLAQICDKYQRTLLHHSVMLEDVFFTKRLLHYGLSTEQIDAYGYAPLHYAAMKGSLSQIRLLIEYSPDTVHSRSHNGATPLIIAITNNHLAAVKLFLESNASGNITLATGYTALHCALHQGNEEIVVELLEGSEEARQTINSSVEEGGSPLMMACEIGSERLVNKFLECGADPEFKRRDGLTALDIAIKNEFLPICRILFRISSFSNHTLELAIKEGSLDLVKILSVRKGDFFQYRNLSNESPLMIAIRHGNMDAAHLILSRISRAEDLTAVNHQGESALDLVVKGKFFTLLEAVLDKTIDGQPAVIIDPMGLLRILCKQGYNYFLRDYLKKQVDLTQNDYQELAQISAEAGQYAVITLLLMPNRIDLDQLQGPNGWKIEYYLAKSDGVFLFRKISKKRDLVDVDYKLEEKTLAYIAAENGSWFVLRFILEQLNIRALPLHNHFLSRHLLYGIIERGELEGVDLFFSIIGNPDLANALIGERGIRPAHLAAQIGSKPILELLFEKGADLEVEDDHGYTPLFYAVRCQSLSAISFLLKHQMSIETDALYEAASSPDKAILDLLLKSNVDIDIRCKTTNETALLKAIKKYDSHAFSLLLASGASVDCQDREADTPLLVASATGQADILQVLLKKISFNESPINGDNALHLACKGKHPLCIKMLLEEGYSNTLPNDEQLLPVQLVGDHRQSLAALGENRKEVEEVLLTIEKAVFSKDHEKIKQIIHEFPINQRISITRRGDNLTGTILHLALTFLDKKEHINEVIQLFFSLGSIDFDLRDDKGNSYSHLLVKAGLDPTIIPGLKLDQINILGQTILHMAAENDDVELLESIISNAPHFLLEAPDRNGLTPIFYAVKAKKQKNVDCLIKRGANGHHRTNQLLTPLLLSCYLDQLAIARTLIESGVDINQRGTVEMTTPLFASLSLEQADMSLYLLFNGSSCSSISSNGDHLAHIAAKTGKLSILKFLSSQGQSLEIANIAGLQPIHLASASGQIKVLSLFNSLGISLNAPAMTTRNESKISEEYEEAALFEKATPLLIAAENGQLDTVNWLLSHYADPEAVSERKWGALVYSSRSRNKRLLRAFEDYELYVDLKQIFPAIIQSILKDDPFNLSLLYQHLSYETELIPGWSGLHVASKNGSLHSTLFFLNHGADPALPSGSGESALEISAAGRSVEQFRLLLKNCDLELNLNKLNGRSETLLHVATRAGNILHIMLLIDYGALLDLTDALGRTPLHIAAQEENQEIALLLIACGADFSKRTIFSEKTALDFVKSENTKLHAAMNDYQILRSNIKEGETLLHLAVKAQNIRAIKLISRYEEVDQQDNEGISPLHNAVRTKNMSIIRLLLKEGAEINTQDLQGETPLWIACVEMRSLALIKFLIKAGANPKIKNIMGITLLDSIEDMDLPEKDKFIEVLG